MIMLFPSSDDEWQRAPQEIDAPLAAMGAHGTRSKPEWTDLGWPLVIDPFSGQVLAFQAMRDAYQHFQEHGTAQRDNSEVFAVYRELPGFAGMEQLYDIEARTTEKI